MLKRITKANMVAVVLEVDDDDDDDFLCLKTVTIKARIKYIS